MLPLEAALLTLALLSTGRMGPRRVFRASANGAAARRNNQAFDAAASLRQSLTRAWGAAPQQAAPVTGPSRLPRRPAKLR